MFEPFSYQGKGILPRQLVCDGKHLIEKVLWRKKQIVLDGIKWYVVDTGNPNAYFYLIVGDLGIETRRYPQRELEAWFAKYFEFKPDEDPEYHRLIVNMANGLLERFLSSGEQTLRWTTKFDGQIHRHDVFFGEARLDFDLNGQAANALANRLAEIAAGNNPANGTIHRFELKLGGFPFSAEGFANKRKTKQFGVPARVEEAQLSLRKSDAIY